MQTRLAQGTRRNNVPKPDFAGGVVISSGAVLRDLRYFEALKIGKQLELVWGSLGLMPGRNRSAMATGSHCGSHGRLREVCVTRPTRTRSLPYTRCRRFLLETHFLPRARTMAEFFQHGQPFPCPGVSERDGRSVLGSFGGARHR